MAQAGPADSTATRMRPAALERYLARIGYDGPRRPDLETLTAIQQAHLAAIPFEAIDVLLGRGIELAPEALESKLISARRGGYCFEQNGLLLRVLRALGFHADALLARVCWMAPEGAPRSPPNHMALRVTLAGEPWLVDAGFGGIVPTAPLRLRDPGPQHCGYDTYRLLPRPDCRLVQVRVSDAWTSMYELLPEPPPAADFTIANWYTATHPDSRFRSRLIVARTSATARYALAENRLTIRARGGTAEQRVLDAAGIEEALARTFGLPVAPDWREIIGRAAAVPMSETG